MERFHVTASWTTTNGGGNWHSGIIEAASREEACEIMAARIQRDKRRRYAKHMRCTAV